MYRVCCRFSLEAKFLVTQIWNMLRWQALSVSALKSSVPFRIILLAIMSWSSHDEYKGDSDDGL